ncbi:MAG: thioredoxin [Candidatus Thermoplasmatota archaeon]|jgi:thioredoxin 1|nr:thioredoxin [Candidatus Thermoplasmatota archaeon]MCL5732456.1 thioredoxin [Candidatus Thermoplasmatota archaeon]
MVTDNIDQIREKMLREMMTPNNSNGDKAPVNTKPMELNDRTFTGEVAKHDLMVVDFWAPWCGPCQYVSPIVEELARDYAGKVAFGKLNVDDNPMVSTQFRVMSIPTIMFFKKGRLVDMQIGAVPKQFLDQKIKKHMAQ